MQLHLGVRNDSEKKEGKKKKKEKGENLIDTIKRSGIVRRILRGYFIMAHVNELICDKA